MRLLFILPTFFLLAAPAIAEEVVPELDEVVVTASRVEEKLADTTTTISVIDDKEIEDVKYRNPDEILRRIPGVYSHNLSGESELTSIRIPTHFTNPYTLLLVDGMRTSSYGSGSSGNFREINSDTIFRMEVLRGPSSALYGSNAIGGVINVITKDPSAEPEVKIWTEFGEDEQWRSSLSGSVSNDKLGFIFDTTYIDSTNWREHADVDKKAADAKLLYAPFDQGLFTFKVDYVDFDNDSPGALNEVDFHDNWRQSYQTFAYTDLKKTTPSVSYTHYLQDAEFKATLLLRDTDEESIPNYAIRKQGPYRYVGQYSESDTTDIDGQLIYSRGFEKFRSKIIVGVDAERGDTDSQQYGLDVDYNRILNKYTGYTVLGIDDDFDITTKMYAPYLQFECSPVEKLRLNAGGRYDDVTYEVDSKVNVRKTGDQDFSKFTPKFGAVYQFSSMLNGYGNISQGFVVPTTSQLLTSSWANIDLEPEEATNYEVGIRSVFLDRKLGLDVAYYNMDIDDKIIPKEITPYRKKYVNTGETSQEGVEVMARYAPVEYGSLSLAYTYARNTFEQYVPGFEDFSGNYLPRSPEHRLNIRLNVQPLENLDIELEMDDISSQYTNDANTEKYNRPTLFNLRMKYYWREWSFWSYVENLTDQEYASYVSYDTGDLTSTFYSGTPLTVYAGLSYTWQGGR
ncbi:MAG: TonB-dependent receptor [Desulforhopalus sp.]